MKVGAIEADIGLNPAPLLRGVDQAVAGVKDMKTKVLSEFDRMGSGTDQAWQRVRQSSEAANTFVARESAAAAAKTGTSWKNVLSDVKGEFGKSSILGQTLKLAMGGGAIAAIGMAANEFATISGKVEG